MSVNGTLADEADVLRLCLSRIGSSSKQVVQDHTYLGLTEPSSAEALERTANYLRTNLKGLREETLADFLEKNREPHPVAPPLTLEGQLLPMSDADISHIFRDDKGWTRFREMYPLSAGTIGFSRVGFDRSLTQAIVYAGIQVDWTAGRGTYTLFAKTDEGWTESATTVSWIS
jgi:hypothetical protein